MTDENLQSDRYYTRMTWAIVVLGVIVRLVRYVLPFPLWGDEIFVCQNFLDRDYRTILDPLENGQICPPLFLWLQLFAYRMLGSSEMAMRLFPMIAGQLSLIFMALLARRLLTPLGAMIATGFLTLAIWPVTMTTFAKPYSFDLLMAVVMQWAAVRWYERRESLGRFAFLAAWMPFAILGSYTASFVAGGVSLALLRSIWKAQVSIKILFMLANLGVLAAFWFNLQVGQDQLKAEVTKDQGIQSFLLDYWKHGFPPDRPINIPLWLLEAHTGRMFAYPIGDSYGGSTFTFLIFLVGIWFWRKSERWSLILLLVPIALNFVAALIHKYPYGACGRLSQYAASAICILAAYGIETIIRKRHPSERTQRFAARVLMVIFVGIGIGHIVTSIIKPYHDNDARWSRDTIEKLDRELGPNDIVVVRYPYQHDFPILRWHVRRMNRPYYWNDTDFTPPANGKICVLDYWVSKPEAPHAPGKVTIPAGWKRTDRRALELPLDSIDDGSVFVVIEIYEKE